LERIKYGWFLSGTLVSSTIKIENFLIGYTIGSAEGGFRLRDERKQAEKCEICMRKIIGE
jgi:hypothetical protein